MIQLLQELCQLNATSGDEKAVSDFILNRLIGVNCSIQIDNLGNVLVFKQGKKRPKNKIMLAAHMDEVGFIVNYIDDEGYLKIAPVGGINAQVVMGRQVVLKSGITGVIGGKPVHKLKPEEKDKQPEISALYVDIGAKTKAEAEQHVALGDNAYFVSDFLEFGSGLIKGKAIDDRLGCAIMLDMLLSELEYDLHFAFTVQEEVGTRGARAAAYTIAPDIAIVLEATTACDIAGSEGADKVCCLGDGVVVTFMDGGTIYDKTLYNLAFDTAKENNLKCQTKTKIAGGNDAGAIHKAIGGIRTVAFSVPCRYLHTPSCVVKRLDCAEMRILTEKFIQRIAEQ